MKTTVNVHLLPTDNGSKIGLNPSAIGNKPHLYYFKQGARNDESHHIYFTLPQSDLEISKIKEGDWYLNGRYIYQADRHYECAEYDEKIVAYTDRTFDTFKKGDKHLCDLYIFYPSIPQSFIEHYITEYNNGNVIKSVDVELEDYFDEIKASKLDIDDYTSDDYHALTLSYKLELTSNNEIVIVSTNRTYNKNEVIELIKHCNSEVAAELGYTPTSDKMKEFNDTTNKWIKKNIK
jgi:hypothetical protein